MLTICHSETLKALAACACCCAELCRASPGAQKAGTLRTECSSLEGYKPHKMAPWPGQGESRTVVEGMRHSCSKALTVILKPFGFKRAAVLMLPPQWGNVKHRLKGIKRHRYPLPGLVCLKSSVLGREMRWLKLQCCMGRGWKQHIQCLDSSFTFTLLGWPLQLLFRP